MLRQNKPRLARILRLTVYIYLGMLLPSCSKLIEVDPPKTQLTEDKIFSDNETANSAMAAVYSFLNQYNANMFSHYTSILPELSADNGEFLGSTFDSYKNNALSPNDSYISSYLWSNPYQAIYMCNAIIEGLQNAHLSEGTRNQLTGEAKFLRAFCYLYLVNYFGGVPLIISTDVRQTALAPKSEEMQVYQQIITDLEDAQELLAENYVSGEKVRANKMSATALLARVYLYLGNWAKAATAASAIINSGAYSLVEDVNNVFLKNSDEAILQFWTRDGYTQVGAFSFSGSATPTYILTNDLIDSFEENDLRKAGWTRDVEYNGTLYYQSYKYKQRSITTGSDAEYYMVLRLAEQYLIRAEARARQDDLSGAVGDLNTIRSRAGLTDLPEPVSKESCLLAVEKERRAELFWEWGHRWFDLKRTNRVDIVLGAKKGDWQASDALYPIPQEQIDKNPNLKQNAGY